MFETVIRPSGIISGTISSPGNSSALGSDVESKWIRWVPKIGGSIVVVAINGSGADESAAISPNIAIYHRHDPTNLNLMTNAQGRFGKCVLRLENYANIIAGVPYTICIDNLLSGKASWELSQIGQNPPMLTPPTFAATAKLLTILPGSGWPTNGEIFFRIKADANNKPFEWAKYTDQVRLIGGTQYTIEAMARASGYLPSNTSEFFSNV